MRFPDFSPNTIIFETATFKGSHQSPKYTNIQVWREPVTIICRQFYELTLAHDHVRSSSIRMQVVIWHIMMECNLEHAVIERSLGGTSPQNAIVKTHIPVKY